MVQDNQIITLDELKRYLNWDSSDVCIDDFFNAVINSVSDTMEQFCNTKLKQCDIAETVSGQGTNKLYLSNRPVTKVKSLKYFDGASFTEYMTEGDISKYIVTAGHTVYHRADVFEEGIYNFEVSYTCGFNPIPQDLKLISLELCAVLFKNSSLGDGRVGLISNQQGNFKMFFLEQLPFHGKIINKYRLVNV